jgi:hypothetical protein
MSPLPYDQLVSGETSSPFDRMGQVAIARWMALKKPGPIGAQRESRS